MLANHSLTRTVVGTVGTAVCAAICLLGATVPAQAQEARTTEVQFTDLNLAQPSGRALLDKRLLRAAHLVCSTDSRSLDRVAVENACVAETLRGVRLPARAIVTTTADAR